MKNKKLFTWGEMAAGYALLFMFCLSMLAGRCVRWVFALPSRLLGGIRR